MKYTVHTRFNKNAICGNVDLPISTECESKDGIIYFEDKPLCLVNSENSHLHFARNNDGLGIERGRVTKLIIEKLKVNDENYQKRWDKIWKCPICRGYKRPEFADHWIWSHAFYNADINNLYHIARILEVEVNNVEEKI